MDIIKTMKAKPGIVVGGAVGLLALFALTRGGASDYSGVALESQRIASDTNVSVAGINAEVSKAALAANTARNEIAGNVYTGVAEIGGNVAVANITAGLQTMLGMLASADNRAAIRSNENIVDFQTASSREVALAELDNNYKMLDRTLTGEEAMGRFIIENYNHNLPSEMEHEKTMYNLAVDAEMRLGRQDYEWQERILNTDYQGQILLADVSGTPARIAAQTARSEQRANVAEKAFKAVASLFGGK